MDNYEVIRILSAFLVGVLITLNGSFSQALTQNPIAAPSTLGVQAVALFVYLIGFVVTKIFGGEYTSNSVLIFHILFFLLSLCISKIEVKGGLVKKIIILGLCLNLFVASIYSLVQFVLLNKGIQFPSELWFGNFRYSTMPKLVTMAIIFAITFSYSFFISKKLRLFILGQEIAKSYLRSFEGLERRVFLVMIYSTCMITFFYGYFSFLGLVFPHLLRFFSFFRNDIHREIVWGALFGGIIFSVIDTLCYNWPVEGAELPIGMITSVLGPLILLVILFSKRNSMKSVY